MPSTWSIPLLCAAAFAGGAVNAIAGGGTLLTFTALLGLLSPVSANATSTMALLPASLAAGLGYRKELAGNRKSLMMLWPPSLVGGIVGSVLLIRMPEKVFASLVPWLLAGASVLLLLQKPLARYLGAHPHLRPKGSTWVGIVIFQLLVGIYGGYFGAGIGILMLSSLAFAGISDIHGMNAVKSILAATMNGVTAIVLASAGVVMWKYAAVMAVAGIAGGYAGARVGRKLHPDYIRALVVSIGFGVAAWSWWSAR